MTGRDKRGGENGNKKDERMNVKNVITLGMEQQRGRRQDKFDDRVKSLSERKYHTIKECVEMCQSKQFM